jgi:predicted metal-dependent phosphoesterase TrpH
MRIDLHTHSTASDGLLTPTELLLAAQAAGLTTLALTDHDSTGGIVEAQTVGQQLGIEVIAGIEVNTDLPGGGGEAHVLGYFLRWDDPTFQAELTTRRAERETRGKQMVAQLQAIGLPITWEQVRRHADGAVGRPHIAAALMEIGAVSSVDEAFATYLGRGMPGYAPRAPYSPSQAIALIRSAHGVASLAHPAAIPDLAGLLTTLVTDGLVGLETYYGQYNHDTIAQLQGLAHRFGLVTTGGSDYHGPNMHPTPLGGQPALPPAALEALRAAAAQA